MDLNYLYSRHQISLMRSKRAASSEARAAHRAFAQAYSARITAMRQATGGGAIAPLEG